MLIRTEQGLHYARADLGNHLAFACVTQLASFSILYEDPAIGDLEADGALELAIRTGQEIELWGITQAP